MSLPRYPEYKDSGVAWLGVVPGHWEVERLKYSVEVRLSNIDKHTVEAEPAVLLCNYVDVYKNERITASIDFMAATASPEQIRRLTLEVGDVIITKDSEDPRDIGVPSLVSEVVPDLVCGYHLALLRPRAKQCGGYFYYLFKSRYVAAAFETEATGMTRYALGKYSIENLNVPLPSLEEQQTIAAFLDRETGKIDALIAEQQRLVELLAEKRQAVISHAVTKGLNPNARMKDSGIEWLGEVPEHWMVVVAKRVSSTFVPQRNKPDLNEDGDGLCWVTMEQMRSETITNTNLWVSETAANDAGTRALVAGAVIASCVGTFGLAAINKSDVIINQQLQAFIPTDRIDAKYLRYCVVISGGYFEQIGTAATIAYVNQIGFANLPLAVPPMDEQHAIVAYLETEATKFDTLTTEANRAIALLQERRSALISAAITGKIDVRGHSGAGRNPVDERISA